jgi:hypothetical protein
MNEQELLARIAELEEENAKLRHTRYKVSIYDTFKNTHGWLRYGRNTTELISKLVRTVCFPRVIKNRKHTWYDGTSSIGEAEYLIETKDMTDEQRALFKEIVKKLLDVLSEYEIFTKENA